MSHCWFIATPSVLGVRCFIPSTMSCFQLRKDTLLCYSIIPKELLTHINDKATFYSHSRHAVKYIHWLFIFQAAERWWLQLYTPSPPHHLYLPRMHPFIHRDNRKAKEWALEIFAGWWPPKRAAHKSNPTCYVQVYLALRIYTGHWSNIFRVLVKCQSFWFREGLFTCETALKKEEWLCWSLPFPQHQQISDSQAHRRCYIFLRAWYRMC